MPYRVEENRQQVHSATLAEAVRKIGRVSLTKALETVANPIPSTVMSSFTPRAARP
jgi:hypothetical protein